MRRRMLAAVCLAAGLSALATIPAVIAAAAPRGTITGRVTECGPGPISVYPPRITPPPAPVVVNVLRDGRTIASETITMPDHLPWVSTFSFSVRPGRYEVVSSYENRSAWVRVRPGATSVVSFGFFACPMQGSPPIEGGPPPIEGGPIRSVAP